MKLGEIELTEVDIVVDREGLLRCDCGKNHGDTWVLALETGQFANIVEVLVCN